MKKEHIVDGLLLHIDLKIKDEKLTFANETLEFKKPFKIKQSKSRLVKSKEFISFNYLTCNSWTVISLDMAFSRD